MRNTLFLTLCQTGSKTLQIMPSIGRSEKKILASTENEARPALISIAIFLDSLVVHTHESSQMPPSGKVSHILHVWLSKLCQQKSWIQALQVEPRFHTFKMTSNHYFQNGLIRLWTVRNVRYLFVPLKHFNNKA